MRQTIPWLAMTLCLVLSTPALAEVTLPDGQVVPKDSGSEVQIYTLFANQGEAIDWQTDARDVPDTFSPLCGFTATLLLKESGSTLGVGWYNADPNATLPPSALEIFQIVPANSPVGTVVAGSDIRSDPNYAGGLIGFALIRVPAHFSETRFNTVCSGGACAATPGPWILAVKYQSVVTPNSYYLAFEDGSTSATGWNNDGDYNDYVFQFTGIACAGAGEPCSVDGATGVCAPGLTECDTTGALVCKQLTQPGDEACDGIDNDCNGETDDGDALCPREQVCVRGTCVPFCGDEFPCFDGDVCEAGKCVHPDCVDVTCDAGQACIEGTCKAPCDGVVCPGSQTCSAGACTDPCLGVSCPEGRVCDGGVCVLSCDCQGCADDLVCNLNSGLCVAAGCETQTCSAGTSCVAGSCLDDCEGAVCPGDQSCVAGQCEGSSASSSDDAGVDPLGPMGAAVDAGGTGVGVDGGGSQEPGRSSEIGGRSGEAEGCGCSVPGARGRTTPALLLLLGLLSAVTLRCSRRRR